MRGRDSERDFGPIGPAASDAVSDAVRALAAGRMIVVTDNEGRENEGDLVVSAELITREQMAFIIRHTTGIVCAPMPAARVDELALPPMVADNSDPHGTAFTVSVDLDVVGTGVSAQDRILTVRGLADPSLRPERLRRPGHVFPLRARPGGVAVRPGHTEAAVDLLTMAGLSGVGVISELVTDAGTMLKGRELTTFAATHDLPILAIDDLVRQRGRTDQSPVRTADAALPTRLGDFRVVAVRDPIDGCTHLALLLGDVSARGRSDEGILARLHSECVTGDVFGSLRCDCGYQLDQAMKAIVAEGCGALVYLRGHEGRGIGLEQKLRAYALQEAGLDTVDANTALGLPVDSRSFVAGARLLDELGVGRVRLMTNNPDKARALRDAGIQVVNTVAMPTAVNTHNIRYLQTKRDRMGHRMTSPPLWNWEH